jgi:NDP-sugar pyrophosphorylase family protein
MIQQAVILVGGRGERLNNMRSFAPAIEVPKPLMEVAGRPFITYAINMLRGVGIQDVILLVGYRKEEFEFLKESKSVKLWETRPDVNEAVLSIPNLQEIFLVLNGDCFPIMDWERLRNADRAFTTVTMCDRDAGCAVIRKSDLSSGAVSVVNLDGMSSIYQRIMIMGCLHIGTPAGLQRARLFFDTVVFGE